jgi:hypothetical protein
MKKSIFLLLAFLTPVLMAAEGQLVKLSTGAEMTVYLPDADKATGRAVVDCPGGGYSHLSMDNEGHNWAAFYNDLGIAYAVLKYRMPKGDRNIPLSDVYEAIKTFKNNAENWRVNPNDIGIQGFSAGGHCGLRQDKREMGGAGRNQTVIEGGTEWISISAEHASGSTIPRRASPNRESSRGRRSRICRMISSARFVALERRSSERSKPE